MNPEDLYSSSSSIDPSHDAASSVRPTSLESGYAYLTDQSSSVLLSTSSVSSHSSMSMDHATQVMLGFDYEFVPPADAKYICPICMLVLRNPVQTECGHRFCSSCIKRWITQHAGGSECPNCKEKVTINQIFPDNFAKREIMNMTLQCPNSKNGCTVLLDLHHVQSHIDSICDYALCPCPNNCSDILLKKDLHHHVTVTCPKLWIACAMCKEKILYSNHESHLLTCEMSLELCTHCGKKFYKNILKMHQDVECPLVIVNCAYQPFGCQHKCSREMLPKHTETSTSDHLQLVAKNVTSLMQQVTALHSTPLKSVVSAQQSVPFYPSRFQKQDSVQSHLVGTKFDYKASGRDLCDLITTMTDAGFESALSSPSLDTMSHLSSSLSSSTASHHVSAVERSYASPDLPSVESVTGSYESRLSQDGSYITTLDDLRQSVIQLQLMFTQQLERLDSLPEEIVARNCNGCFLWRIDNIDKHRQAGKNGTQTALHSRGFYTSVYGYKICIRVNVNGIEKGYNKHVALFVHFMKGEYDDVLSWPFQGTITLSILDQSGSKDGGHHFTESLEANPNLAAFARPVASRNHKGFGYIEFAPLSILDDPRYVKNNVLFIRATVTVSENLKR